MLDYRLWLVVGVDIGVYAAPTLGQAKAQLLRRPRELDTTTARRAPRSSASPSSRQPTTPAVRHRPS
jgi:hypothetical protein